MGRFRNLVQTTVVPIKRARYDGTNMGIQPTSTASHHGTAAHANSHQIFQQHYQEHAKNLQNPSSPTNNAPPAITSLYQGLPATTHEPHTSRPEFDVSGPLAIGAKLGLLLPNPAPDVTPVVNDLIPTNAASEAAKAQKLAMANANGIYFTINCLLKEFNIMICLLQYVMRIKCMRKVVGEVRVLRKRNTPKRPGQDVNLCLVLYNINLFNFFSFLLN